MKKTDIDIFTKTTVIIPNYNGKQYLQDCLTFLYRNKGTSFRVIVVDDASTDDSWRIVEQKFPKAALIRLQENGGFAHAVNVGIRAADTEYVLLLNNDTVTEPDFVLQMEKAISKNKRIFSASAKMLSMKEPEIIDGVGDEYCALGWAFARGKGESAERYSAARRVFSACGGAAIYRRNVLVRLGMFDENHFAYLEDVDVGYRALLHGFLNVTAPAAIVYHAGSGTSGSRHNAFKVDLSSRNSVYLIAKNMPLLQLILNLPFLLVGFFVKACFFTIKGLGGVYIRGLWKGIRLSLSEKGRSRKVRFSLKRLPSYIMVQLLLWKNLALSTKIR
ncbi:MAG: glycosyltransferase family 2 protein [Lachnospiraceae bacterium]|nr:glycosyltransferase family 2 protein [Lachnospiraceae bacterium]